MLPKVAVASYLRTIKNPITLRCYSKTLEEFIKNIYILKGVTNYTIENFKNKLLKYSATTIASKLAAIRSFLDYCWEQGWIASNPSLIVKQQIIPKYNNSKNITFKDFQKLITISKTTGHTRDNLLLLCLYMCGSIEQVLELRWNDRLPKALLKFKQQYKKQLNKFLTKEEVSALQKSNCYLFFNLRSKNILSPLTRRYVRFLLENRNLQAGFDKRYIDFVALKRLGAKEIYLKTQSLEQVMKYCGHKHKRTTYTFIQNLS